MIICGWYDDMNLGEGFKRSKAFISKQTHERCWYFRVKCQNFQCSFFDDDEWNKNYEFWECKLHTTSYLIDNISGYLHFLDDFWIHRTLSEVQTGFVILNLALFTFSRESSQPIHWVSCFKKTKLLRFIISNFLTIIVNHQLVGHPSCSSIKVQSALNSRKSRKTPT